MKKNYLTLFFILTNVLCFAQKKYDSAALSQIENINKNIERILEKTESLNFIYKQKTDSLILLKNYFNSRIDNLETSDKQKTDEIKSLNDKIKFQKEQTDTIAKFKIYTKSIVTSLMSEHYNFSPSIVNILSDIKTNSYLTDKKYKDTLEKFITISAILNEVEKYLDTEPYDKEKVKSFKKILEDYKNEKDTEKFSNLKLDINKYIGLLKAYCEASNKIYNAIAKSVDIPKVRSEMLAEEIEIYGNNYGYLLKLIGKANSDRKFDIKPETCPVQ
jgi:hypothetical protein